MQNRSVNHKTALICCHCLTVLCSFIMRFPWKFMFFLCSFQQDCEDSNPLIRALAVRTMGCIRVDKITEYLCEPLRKCLRDDDPYVRKTAAVCVAKLYDISSSMVSFWEEKIIKIPSKMWILMKFWIHRSKTKDFLINWKTCCPTQIQWSLQMQLQL